MNGVEQGRKEVGAIDRLVDQRNKLNARIEQLRNREFADERKRDTRRKILAGAYFIRLLDNDLQRVGRELIAEKMLLERDYPLFGLGRNTNQGTPEGVPEE